MDYENQNTHQVHMTTNASSSIEVDLPSIFNDTQTGASASIETCFSAAAISSPVYHPQQGAYNIVNQFNTSSHSVEHQTTHAPGDISPSHTLRPSHSFRLDEGYGEEAIGIEDTHLNNFDDIALENLEQLAQRIRSAKSEAGEIELPSWMMALNDDLRRELAYKLVRSLPTSSIAAIVERLIPILHLDFVALLPSELSLQIFSYLEPAALIKASLANKTWRKFAMEPRLWKGLYKSQDWSFGEAEAQEFEREMRGEGRRKAQQVDGLFKNRNLPGVMGGSIFGNSHMDTDSISSNAAVAGSASGSTDQPFSPPPSTFTPHQSAEDDDMYPSPPVPQRPANFSPSVAHTSLEPSIAPSLTTYGLSHPRLNWAYIYKNRKKLEENWQQNRYIALQIPHPNYLEEGHSECIYTIQYSQKYLLSGSRDRTIKIWSMRTRRLVKSLAGHEGSVLCLQFDESPDEDIVYSGSSDTNVISWRFSTGERLKTITRAHNESVLNLRFNKKYIVTCSKDKFVKVWSRSALEPHQREYTAAVQQISMGNNRLISPSMLGSYSVINPNTVPKDLPPLTLIHTLRGHGAAVNAIQLLDEEVVSVSGDRLIKLWNIQTGNCERSYVGHGKGIACIQYDGKQIVSGSSDKSIRVFDKVSLAEIARLEGHAGLVRTVQAGGPRNARIVSGGYDETIRVWRKQDEHGNLDDGENPGLYGSLREGVSWVTTGILRHIDEATDGRHRVHHSQGPAPAFGTAPLQGFMHAAGTAVQQGATTQTGWTGWMNPMTANTATHAAPAIANMLQQPANGQALPVPAAHPIPVALPPAGPVVAAQSQNKVFKLQFDARFIWCCSQDTRIVGWDFAAGDPDIIEASRFF